MSSQFPVCRFALRLAGHPGARDAARDSTFPSSGGLARADCCPGADPAAQLKADIEATCASYEKTDVMIPMRDGVKLAYRNLPPQDSDRQDRDRHGAHAVWHRQRDLSVFARPDHVDAGRARRRVYFRAAGHSRSVQIRRRIRDGEAGPPSQRPEGDRRKHRRLDTVDWLVKNVPDNNGKVSALPACPMGGWTAIMAAIDPHPAVAAVSPQASPIDIWMGDDFWRNGALRLNYMFEYTGAMELSKTMEPFAFDQTDSYAWYLKQGALKNFDTDIIHGRSRTWTEMMQHQTYDSYWRSRNFTRELKDVRRAGAEHGRLVRRRRFLRRHADRQGDSVERTARRRSVDARELNAAYADDKTGIAPIDFGADTGAYWRQEIQRPFLAHYLLGKPAPDLPRALSFRTGVNEWKRYDSWPPKPAQGVQTLTWAVTARSRSPTHRRPSRAALRTCRIRAIRFHTCRARSTVPRRARSRQDVQVTVGELADSGSALRRRPARHVAVLDHAVDRVLHPHRRSRTDLAHHHDRHRRRLHRQAARRLPRHRCRQLADGGLSDDARSRRAAGPVSSKARRRRRRCCRGKSTR